MEKLKKLFPISFKFCQSVPKLFLCAFLYVLAEFGICLAISLIVQPIIGTILEILFSPITIFAWIVYILAIVICCTGVGIIIGLPLAIIALFVVLIPSTITAAIITILSSVVTYYMIAGFVVAVLAYAGVFGEIPAPEKKSKKAKEEVEE